MSDFVLHKGKQRIGKRSRGYEAVVATVDAIAVCGDDQCGEVGNGESGGGRPRQSGL